MCVNSTGKELSTDRLDVCLYLESRSDTGKLMDQFIMRCSAYRKKKKQTQTIFYWWLQILFHEINNEIEKSMTQSQVLDSGCFVTPNK